VSGVIINVIFSKERLSPALFLVGIVGGALLVYAFGIAAPVHAAPSLFGCS
jgi:hypothetical protein